MEGTVTSETSRPEAATCAVLEGIDEAMSCLSQRGSAQLVTLRPPAAESVFLPAHARLVVAISMPSDGNDKKAAGMSGDAAQSAEPGLLLPRKEFGHTEGQLAARALGKLLDHPSWATIQSLKELQLHSEAALHEMKSLVRNSLSDSPYTLGEIESVLGIEVDRASIATGLYTKDSTPTTAPDDGSATEPASPKESKAEAANDSAREGGDGSLPCSSQKEVPYFLQRRALYILDEASRAEEFQAICARLP